MPWRKRRGAEIIAGCHATRLLGRDSSDTFATLVHEPRERGGRLVRAIVATARVTEEELASLLADDELRRMTL